MTISVSNYKPSATNRKPRYLFFLLALCFSFIANAADRETNRMERRAEKLAASLRDIQSLEGSQIPPNILKQAKGVIILKQYEAGVIFGAMGGFGIVAVRNDEGNWSTPAWLKTGQISGGLQLGAQKLNLVLLIVKEEGLEMLKKAKFQIGVDASVVRGPTGSNPESKADADILAYTVYEGIYAGATFEGGFLLPDKKLNEYSYGQQLAVLEIINSHELKRPEPLNIVFESLQAIENGQGLEQLAGSQEN
ncbi:lipid-binding SYLF domain-containing protein [Pelagicoccus albus]|uniref:Lipid-binding SYLF domain-containing protein n=1 Tax=Pelagicoccus albus TaxID=415222 RepID=A0A7X1EBV7_9BACT|nr:lipid-binding SYLF domain-containing protein [Pelagicoccus albus]MBC2608227.1 lipid-binding SYLF domain-containing protein [Pelagicoccus albus]